MSITKWFSYNVRRYLQKKIHGEAALNFTRLFPLLSKGNENSPEIEIYEIRLLFKSSNTIYLFALALRPSKD